MIRSIALMTALLAVFCCANAKAEQFSVKPDLARAYLLRINGQTLLSHDAEKRLPQASLTKIMTALLILEDYRPDQVVTVSRRAARATGSRLNIKAGERYTVESLLTGALMASGNDACSALAEWRGGTEKKFVVRMNKRAAQLGLKQTRFENACGHHAAKHYSSAQDLATLAETALRNPVFAQIVRREYATVTTSDGARSFHIRNTNALIGRHPDAIGVKSGYTRQAGKCLITLAERNGIRVLLVMLNARDRWWDAHATLDQAFEYAAKNKPD